MHAAVWSQPIARSKLRRCQSQRENPETTAGKAVLGVGISMTLCGGLMIVLGVTGYFVRGGNKYYLGFGAPTGLLTLLTGLAGTKSVSRAPAWKRGTVVFSILAILATAAAVAMVVLACMVLGKQSLLLLTLVICISETVIGSLVCLLALGGLIVLLCRRFNIERPSPHRNAKEDVPKNPESPPHSDSESPEADLSLMSDVRVRI